MITLVRNSRSCIYSFRQQRKFPKIEQFKLSTNHPLPNSLSSSLHSRGGIGQHRVQCIECRLAAHRIDLFEIGLPKAVLTSTTRCKLSQAQSLTCVSGWADAGDFSIADKDALASVLANVHVPLVVHTAQVVPSVAWRSSWSVELAS